MNGNIMFNLLLMQKQPWLLTLAAPVQMAVCTKGGTNVHLCSV